VGASNYLGRIVPKPWGYEYCAFDNTAAAVWVLHIARGRKTSRHMHRRKVTHLVMLHGEALCAHDDATSILKPLDRLRIGMGEFHQTSVPSAIEPTSENGAWLLEIEEPSDKTDLVRAEDAYGRAGQPIESHTVPAEGLLALSREPQSFMGYRFQLESTLGGDLPDATFGFGGVTLGIYREKTVKLSDYVAQFVQSLGIRHVFSVSGGGSMHLVDSFRDLYIACHHEQAAAMAAESYARMNGIGCALVTTGPGGTNALTGVACAWVDSIPLLIISGQVTRDTMLSGGVRQMGVQETDIATLAKPITKYAVTVRHEDDIRLELERAVYIARSGRPGPVWVDIPLDLQGKRIDPEKLVGYTPVLPTPWPQALGTQVEVAAKLLAEARRPVLVVGNGVRLSVASENLRTLAQMLRIPVISSWTAADMVADLPNHIGHCGIFGDRAANFAVQNADLVLAVGCRLSVPQIGYNARTFARGAKLVVVDIDAAELAKPSIAGRLDMAIQADAGSFLAALDAKNPPAASIDWLTLCLSWRKLYPVVLPEYAEQEGVNSFHFIETLCRLLPEDAVVVTDMGTAFTCTFQTAKMRHGQRWSTASGHAPMGYGLPGAVGAAFATGRRVFAIVGDGGLQMNIQELATIAHYRLPITIFVLSNDGYLTIRHMQANHFGRMVGSDAKTDFALPELICIADAYGLEYRAIVHPDNLAERLAPTMADAAPSICEIFMPRDQPLVPRVSSIKRPDGQIASRPLEDMYPFLPRDEFRAQMIVPPVEVLS
jgi:acetolactate synthase I/II/III large subunit